VAICDLVKEDTTLYNGLQHVLECTDENDLQLMTENFTAQMEKFGSVLSVELIPGGNKKKVTLENKHEYVQNLVNFYLTGKEREREEGKLTHLV
jgi:hypothetical protein